MSQNFGFKYFPGFGQIAVFNLHFCFHMRGSFPLWVPEFKLLLSACGLNPPGHLGAQQSLQYTASRAELRECTAPEDLCGGTSWALFVLTESSWGFCFCFIENASVFLP